MTHPNRTARIIGVLALLAIPFAHASDSTQKSPAWSWGSDTYTSDFKIDTNASNCDQVNVPFEGDNISKWSSTTRSCPSSMVAHGYSFNKDAYNWKVRPRYGKYAGTACGAERDIYAQQTVWNPDREIEQDKYTFSFAGQCTIGPGEPGILWKMWEKNGWRTKKKYRIQSVTMNCCPAKL